MFYTDEMEITTVKTFFKSLTNVFKVVENLIANQSITLDTVHSFDDFCSGIISDFLAAKYLALTVTDEINGFALEYDVHIFNDDEARRAYIESALESGKKSEAVTVGKLAKIAPDEEWSNPYKYRLNNNYEVFHIKHVKIDY